MQDIAYQMPQQKEVIYLYSICLDIFIPYTALKGLGHDFGRKLFFRF